MCQHFNILFSKCQHWETTFLKCQNYDSAARERCADFRKVPVTSIKECDECKEKKEKGTWGKAAGFMKKRLKV
jgi:hypothetical protein